MELPQEYLKEMQELLKEEYGDWLSSFEEEAVFSLRVNTHKISPEEFQRISPFRLSPVPWTDDAFYYDPEERPAKHPYYYAGLYYLQEASAMLPAETLPVEAGDLVLDVCAAPGGKSFAAAMQMENRGSILSCDIHPHKLALIEAGAKRLGIDILTARLRDASQPDDSLAGQMDAVLADVPCSGLGVIRKKPDIRYKDVSQMAQLPTIQRAILEASSRCVRSGGVLLYSTCTVLRRENEEVCRAFLADHPEFSPEAFAVPERLSLPNSGMATLLPFLHDADGFFICKLRRAP